jgi:hypothetical protein
VRYWAALSYAVAIAAGSGALLNTAVIAVGVALGTLCTIFAIQHIVAEAVRDLRAEIHDHLPPTRTRQRRWF